ncbi:hypothetical protein OAF52_01880 [bacterium]|jgi:hypothetical protein|nr:hypothetical protein [bacterium]
MRFAPETLEILGLKPKSLPNHGEIYAAHHQERQNRLRIAPKFKYLSGYQPLTKAQQAQISEEYSLVLDLKSFRYEIAEAEEDCFSESQNLRIKRKIKCIRLVDQKTEMHFDCDLSTKPFVHILFLGLKDPQKPIGFFKMKNSMERFRNWLEENQIDGAYGRSVASQYSTKLNFKRYPHLDGDWRRAKANVKSSKGQRSKGLDKLSALYLRTELFIPFPKENQTGDGLKILMPTKSKMKEMWLKDPKEMEELTKFSKYEYNRNKNRYK